MIMLLLQCKNAEPTLQGNIACRNHAGGPCDYDGLEVADCKRYDCPYTPPAALCPECGKMKPESAVHMDLDWRRADRPRLDDPIPKSLMCHDCFVAIRDEFAPLAPYWDSRGNKHYKDSPNMEVSGGRNTSAKSDC